MLRFLLFISVLVIHSNLFSQPKLDSLMIVSKKLMMTNRDSFYKVSNNIIALSKEFKNDTTLTKAYFARAMMYQLTKNYSSSIKYYDSILDINTLTIKDRIRATIGKAETMSKLNYPDKKVLRLLDQSVKEALEINDSITLSSVYFRYSSFYLKKGNYINAIKILIKSSEVRPKKLQLPKTIDLVKISKLFLQIDNLEKAKYYITKAHEIAKKNKYKLDDRIIAVIRGQIALRNRNFIKAEKFFNIALQSYQKSKIKNDIFNVYVFLAELKLEQEKNKEVNNYLSLANNYLPNVKNKLSKAKYYLIKAENNIKKNNLVIADSDLNSAKNLIENQKSLIFKIDLFKTYALLERTRKRYKKSLLYTEEYHELQDSLLKFKTAQNIFNLEAQYHSKEKQKQIELLETKNNLYQNKLKQEKLEKFLILGGGFIGFIFLLFLGVTYYKVREKNKTIEKALKQKEILMKEIHHRVKNNLQLISSLLNLQSKYIKDKKAKQVSLDGKNRVRAMSLIHQFLYQKDDLINLSLDEYFKKLVKELFEAYHIPEEKIKTVFNIQKIEMDVDRVIPLGLIFNEIFTNILKYAFPGDMKGEIIINFGKENKKIKLEIIDNGVGFDKKNDFSNDNTFGFTLIDALLKKWNGIFRIESNKGTKATIVIPDIYKN